MFTTFRDNFLFIFLSVSLLTVSQNRNQVYLSYIDQYHQLAEKQQKEHKIPASIVLAQGLIESGAGQSNFAKQSNNHFGIKCNSDWTGAKIYHDDDQQGECFRKYDQVLDSYEDHASFLKNRPRYAFLFDLKMTDYEGWAHGLKKAGYATDPTYDYKLISLIEDYNLHRFDLGDNLVETEINKTTGFENNISMGTIQATTNHQLFKVNGVEFVVSFSGDTYATIADEFNMSEAKIRQYNEVDSKSGLVAGTRIFIESKKNKAPKECESHVVQDGESMYSISQDYGVKIENLYLLNNLSFNDGVSYGQTLKLR
jgi:LysM repeat protein